MVNITNGFCYSIIHKNTRETVLYEMNKIITFHLSIMPLPKLRSARLVNVLNLHKSVE